jgi:hypothetical protein
MKTNATVRLALLLVACQAAPLAAAPADPKPPVATALDALPSPDLLLSRDLNRTDAINARLSTRSVTTSLKGAPFVTRDEVILLAERGVVEGRATLDTLRTASRAIGDGPREDLDLAFIKAEQARDRLFQSVAKAKESTEARWDDIRTELAERYEQFAATLEASRKLAVENGARFDPVIIAPPTAPDLSAGG